MFKNEQGMTWAESCFNVLKKEPGYKLNLEKNIFCFQTLIGY